MWTILASKPVVCLLTVAFFLRMAAAIVVQHRLDHHWQRRFVIEGDAEGYWMLGQAIADGSRYAAYDPPRYVLRMPGFPLLLAIPIRLGGGRFLAARIFLAIIGTAACALVYLLGRDLCSNRTGLFAGWFTALSPALVGFSVMILSETAFALGILASLWGIVRLVKSLDASHRHSVSSNDQNPTRPTRQRGENSAIHSIALRAGKLEHVLWAMFTGAMIALATYMRPTWLPMAGLFPLGLIALAGFRKETILAGGVILATVAFLMLPWAIRNHQVTGHWVVTTLWSGPSLYDGMNPEADGSSDMKFMAEDNLSTRMTEYELNRHYWQKGMKYAKSHPGRAVELAFLKLKRYWSIWPAAEEAGGFAVRLAISLFTIVLFGGAIFGVWFYRRKAFILAITLGPVLFFAAIHAVFVGSIRYRLPAEYPLAVISAAGWLRLLGNPSAEKEPGGESA